MAINPKVFTAVTALTGGCVGLSLYLLKSGNTFGVVAQPGVKAASSTAKTPVTDAPQEKKSIAKGECEVKDLSQDVKGFLGNQYQDKEKDYTSVFCKNTSLKNDYAPLPSGWEGWFPKFIFSNEDAAAIGTKFELRTETKQEESNWGSYTEVTFSGAGLKSSFVGKWDEKNQSKLKKTVVTVQVSEKSGNKKSGLIYLFLPLSENSSDQA